MGTQKLLLPLGGKPLIARVVDTVLAAGLGRTTVVVGPEASAIVAALSGRDVDWVVNARLESEMLDSLRCGLRALPAHCGAFLVVLGDQPSFPTDLIARLVQAWRAEGRGLVVPVVESKRGHPVLIDLRYREEILNGFEAEGLRGLFRAHSEDVAEVRFNDSAILRDLDTPADYERARRL